MITPHLIFFIAELSDIVITWIGISTKLSWEINPIGISTQMIVTKLIIIVCVTSILYLKPKRKIDWIVPIVAGTPVLWNLFVLSLEIFT